ncbi:D-glycero-beta-D-manno-heptose 1,7-bisphosphate 7-phosphatase [Moritella marina ATCC 15381]|uniref:D,D-heptose 1,7-bisphosphate phosphatase n=1 Tax=Moritella marina ATCC 15381 TaxID=1202962 RepID=A0A5J6WLL7_MORMI|nr:D-glycero-beta-D-manno-heptose 1,7-bisphosphate 7-phosphatase [Moritella marina]QFI38973.1 D-glycero-beta-D-manno-heptose 1,7-bisphosphate 7-phosphatase [Moritella marina ATCC 15381]
MLTPAIFLDRDGVINQDKGYVSQIDDFEFIDGSIEAMLLLKQHGYLLIVITNQSGIARGYYSEEEFMTLTEWMDWSLADRGVDLDGIYFCPHHPEKGIGEYKQDCTCRKPNTGMLESAAKELEIDFANSYLVGDKLSDIEAGQKAQLKANYLVSTGKVVCEKGALQADVVFKDLLSAAKFIVNG